MTPRSVRGILQARILEWVAITFSRGSSQPKNLSWVSCNAGRFFIIWATREASKKLHSTSQTENCIKRWSSSLFDGLMVFGGLIHYTFQNSSETIPSEKYAQQIDKMHQKLQRLQWALINRKDSSLFHNHADQSSHNQCFKMKWKSLSHVQLFATPCTIKSMKFSRPENWNDGLSLLQGIFSTQRLNPGLLHKCRWFLYQLSHRGSPRILEWVACPFSESSRPRNQTWVSCIAGILFANWALREAHKSKVERIGLQNFASSVIFTWLLILTTQLPLLQAFQQLFSRKMFPQ